MIRTEKIFNDIVQEIQQSDKNLIAENQHLKTYKFGKLYVQINLFNENVLFTAPNFEAIKTSEDIRINIGDIDSALNLFEEASQDCEVFLRTSKYFCGCII